MLRFAKACGYVLASPLLLLGLFLFLVAAGFANWAERRWPQG